MVERNLAKVEVASSSLVSRSRFDADPGLPGFVFSATTAGPDSGDAGHRPGGRVVMQRPAKPRTPVQFRPRPPSSGSSAKRVQPPRSIRHDACLAQACFCSGFNRPSRQARYAPRPGGETGIRKGLKIPRPQGHAGSTPAPGTRARDCARMTGQAAQQVHRRPNTKARAGPCRALSDQASRKATVV